MNTWAARFAGHERKVASNVDIDTVTNERVAIKTAVEYVVRRFALEFADKTIIFVLDAPRPEIYGGKSPREEIRWMHDVLRDACQKHQVLFLDLTDAFTSSYSRNGRKFETEWDSHWNEVGHLAAAEAVFNLINSSKRLLRSNYLL
jgi:hypothetical protein